MTPDFVVHGLERHLIVELWTRREPDHVRRAGRSWAHLRDRVARIPLPVGLHIVGPRREQLRPPDLGTSKRIAKGLQKWLLSRPVPPAMGASRSIEGYDFRVASNCVPGLFAQLVTPTGGGWTDSTVPLSAIREKVSKYAAAARDADADLLVVAAAEPNVPLTLDLLKDALAGKQTLSFPVDVLGPPGRIFEWKSDRWTTDIPETFDPALSGLGWLDVNVDEPGMLTLLPVSSAKRPLPRLDGPLLRRTV